MRDRDVRAAGIVLAGLLPMGLGALLVLVRDEVDNANIALALVVTVVVAAQVGGRLAGAVAAVSAAATFDFFFTMPYLSLTIDSSDDVETTALLLVVGLLVGTIATRGQRARTEATEARDEIRRVHRLAELVATDLPAAAVIATAENELTELLQLSECRFEAPPYTSEVPVLERSGAVAGTRHVFTPDGFELPSEGVQLPVLARGRPVGRFLLVPTPGVGLSLADQVGGLMGSSASDRHPTD
jgi:K+-sensing histidine kinase KdpD